jgi:hypothetical protein
VKFAAHGRPPDPPIKRQFTYSVPPSGLVVIEENLRDRTHWTDGVKIRWANGVVMGTRRLDWLLALDQQAPIPVPRFLFVDSVREGSEHYWIYMVGTEDDETALREKLWPKGKLNNQALKYLMASRGAAKTE